MVMDPHAPLVSIVVPSYNAAATLEEMITSVLRQSFADFELVICNDASTDDTVERISRCDDDRIRLLNNVVNSGEGVTRDNAIAAARGKWVAVLDADDAWRPTRLEVLLDATRDQMDVMVFDNIMICHDTEQGLVEWRSARPRGAFGARYGHPVDVELGDYIRSNRLLIKPLIPRQKLVDTGIRHSRRKFAADSEFFIRLGLSGLKLRYVPQPLYLYRVTPGSATARAKDEHLMRECLQELVAEAASNREARSALDSKISALRRHEKLYALARAATNLRPLEVLSIVVRAPSLLLYAPRLALRRILYHAHRMLKLGRRT